MSNLKNYICALKSTWIRRLILNDSKYKTMFEAKYSNIKEIVNRGLEFVRKMLNDKTNKFWNDVLGSWIEICNKQYPTNVEDVLLTNIWDNKYIKIDNKNFFYRRWYEKNIHFIKDILNDEGNLMDFNQFRDKYDLQINYMQYYGVRSAVELYIRKIGIAMNIDSLTNCFIPFNIKLLLKSRKDC